MITSRQLMPWTSTATLTGEWWPKNNPALRYPGVLTTADALSHLTVSAPPIGQEVFQMGDALTVYGTVDGPRGQYPITLWDRGHNFLRHENNGTDHTRKFTHAIVGAHLDSYSDAAFGYSAARFHDLGSWSRFRQVVPEETPDDELPHHKSATLKAPYADLFDDPFTVTVRLEYPSRVESTSKFPGGVIRNHQDEDARVVFTCQPPAPALLHELLLKDFQDLLTFCFQSGAPVLGEWIGTDPTRLYPVLRKDTYRGDSVGHLAQSQMIVTPDDMPFGELVERWWTVLESDFPAPQVLTTYLHLNRGLLEQSTASVLAATENIHSQIGPSKERFPVATLEQNKLIVKKAFPGKGSALFRAFLYEKFLENRPTLDTKLGELVDAVTIDRLTVLEIEPEGWKELYKKVRNKLAHTGAHVLRRGESGEDLDRINAQTRAILSLLLLT